MIVITGANGNLGRRLLEDLSLDESRLVTGSSSSTSRTPLRAVVRSERAAQQIRGLKLEPEPEIRIVDYLSEADMAAALAGATRVVHLVGILKESRSNTYRDAHEGACEVLARAAAGAGVGRVVYLSIVGSDPAAGNECLASRGRAERALLAGSTPVLVIRVPMVLGEGDHAARALWQRARRRFSVTLRGASLEQPIYAGDVLAAIRAGVDGDGLDDVVLDLAGPTSLSRAELTRLAAECLSPDTRPADTTVISLPLAVGMATAWLLEKCAANPPVTRAMLGVLDHDDVVDPGPAARRLGIELTPLRETLTRVLGGDRRRL